MSKTWTPGNEDHVDLGEVDVVMAPKPDIPFLVYCSFVGIPYVNLIIIEKTIAYSSKLVTHSEFHCNVLVHRSPLLVTYDLFGPFQFNTGNRRLFLERILSPAFVMMPPLLWDNRLLLCYCLDERECDGRYCLTTVVALLLLCSSSDNADKMEKKTFSGNG